MKQTKKGNVIIMLFAGLFIFLFIAIFLGVSVYTFNTLTSAVGQNVNAGSVNLQNATNLTLGQMNTALQTHADVIGIILLAGLVITMLINSFVTGSKNPKLFMVIDILILILFFIPAVYVSRIYNTFITEATTLSSTFTGIIPKTSTFLLNLPIILGITGVIMIIISYAGLKRFSDVSNNEVNVLGY